MSVNSLRAAACALLLVSGAASAEVRTFYVTGTVIESQDGSAALGSKVYATFSYDDAAANTSTLNWTGHYDLDAESPSSYFTGSYGTHIIDGDHFHVDVYNNVDGSDAIQFGAFPAVRDDEVMLDGVFSIRLQTEVGHQDAINTQSLPAYLNLADWSPRLSFGELRRDGGQTGGIVRFSIDSIESACQKQNGQAAKKNCWSH